MSAPGVPQQLSKPQTCCQSSSSLGLAQQGLPQKPGSGIGLEMGMKTKTMTAAEQMWGPTPSAWLEGTQGAGGQGKPAWTQRGCHKPRLPGLHLCPLSCPLAGSSHPFPRRTACTHIWATQVLLVTMETGAPL